MGKERTVVILENGLQIERMGRFLRTFGWPISKFFGLSPNPRIRAFKTVYDMEGDYLRGKISGYEVPMDDPVVRIPSYDEMQPILAVYESHKNLRKGKVNPN